MCAVMEYITRELVDGSGMAAGLKKKSKIYPRHINAFIRTDDEFKNLLAGITIPQSTFISSYDADDADDEDSSYSRNSSPEY